MTIYSFLLRQSKLAEWDKESFLAFTKKEKNYIDWYLDGKINIFCNYITENLESSIEKK